MLGLVAFVLDGPGSLWDRLLGRDHVKRTYDAVALLGYRFKPRENLNINVFAGYRYLYIHYTNIGEIEVAIKGAFLGLALEFGHKMRCLSMGERHESRFAAPVELAG